MAKNIKRHITHLKSKVVENNAPKLISGSDIYEGEIAVNYAKGYETLSIKNESGETVTFLPRPYNSARGGETIHPIFNGTGTVGGTNLSAAWSGNCDDIKTLYDGLTILYKVNTAGHNSGDTLSINGGEPHKVLLNASSNLTIHYPVGSIIKLTYDSTQSASFYTGSTTQMTTTGVWKIENYDSKDYYINFNTVVYKTDASLYRYMILLSNSETTLTPVNTTNNTTAGTKTLTTSEFNPFGDILYYSSTTTISANANIPAFVLWAQYSVNLSYSFNTTNTLTAQKAVYIVATPQANGKAKLYSTPITQALPTTDDGRIYIYLGQAISTTNIYLMRNHPVYQYKFGQLRQYVGSFGTMASANTSSYSSATQVNTALGNKVDKVTGKGLSTNDYTTDEKNKLSGIASGAEVNVQSDWNATSGDAFIKNKPTIPDSFQWFGTSSTAADTVQKEVSIPSITSLKTGQIIVVKPTVTSTVANSTLKLNDFDAYPMRYNNAAITTGTDSIVWSANIPSLFVFDGSYWEFLGHGLDSNTTYSTMSVAEGTAGTATSARTMRADYLKQIIQAWAPQSDWNATSGNAVILNKPTIVTGVTLAGGTNNGTVKLTVNGSATDNIAVKGLGTAAYKAEGYFAGSGHSHTNMVTGSSLTANNIILGNGNSAIKDSGKSIETTLSSTLDTAIPTSKAVATYVTSQMTSVLTYKGAISANTTLQNAHKVGDVYVVSSAGTYAGKACEVGDYLIANTARESASTVTNADWDAINGENQVENKSASLAAAGSSATLATVDGTNITVTTPSTWTGVAKTGTVTKVSTASGLTGGNITSTGTIGLAATGTAGTYKQVVVDVYGRVISGNTADNNTWRNVKVNGTEKLTTATTSGSLDITTGSTNGTISVAGTDVAVKGLASLAYASTVNPNAITSGYLESRVYYNTHSENNGGIIPFIYNDIAFITKRGGTVTSYTTTSTTFTASSLTTASTLNLGANMFDGSPSYQSFTVTATSVTAVIDITLHKLFAYSTVFYIDFGAAQWRAKDVSVYVMNSQTETEYTNKGSVTNSAYGHWYTSFSHSSKSGGTTVQGFNKLRIVCTNWYVTNPRIAQIGLINYGSVGVNETFVSRGGSTMYGDLTPYANTGASLGSSSKYWNNVYAKSFVRSGGTSSQFLKADGSVDSNTYITHQDISGKADKATTLAGYGITDAYTKTQIDTSLSTKQNTLEFESGPTKNSTKMLNSGVLYRTFNKAAAWDFDSEATNVITPGLIRKLTNSTSSNLLVYIDRSRDDSSVCRYGLLIKSLKQDVNTVQVTFWIRDEKYSYQTQLSKAIPAKGSATSPYNYFEISLIGQGYFVEDKGNIYFDY